MGVTISKRRGFSLIVFVAVGFANLDSGIDGSGLAVSDQSAEDLEKWSLPSQTLCHRYLGWSSRARSLLNVARLFSMSHLLTAFACMSEPTIIS